MQMNELPLPQTTGARAVPVTGVRSRRFFEGTDWVAEEIPVALEYNGVSHAVMLASPSDLEDFAFGFSLTEGIVDDISQIRDIDISGNAQGITVHMEIASSCFARLKDRRRSLAGRTGCGLCGTDSLAHAVRLPQPLGGDARFSALSVTRALAALRDKQLLLGITGATHAAAWCNAAGEIMLLREDVGRHNALDKLVGALRRGKFAAGEGFVVVTSRASYEMVHKTAVAGVTLLAAVSGVTGLAIDVARDAGVALLGFARGEDLSVYCHAERIHLDHAA
ncbi:formate dehydrogenase accessory sulfurtransferase FdhD [Polaromonas sp. YR568]|uniref:formate dehydrogenase accessory sulfurtransferase FdhD n=1 Tax=Polaromonas sp. YR568 TaxID=1855301 RepID=UPI00398C1FCB